jgi:phosphatidylinositol glycan class P protein
VKEWKKAWSRGTDAVMDVPLGGVCEVLYGDGRDDIDTDDD